MKKNFNKTIKKNNSGFTLIEILVVTVIAGMVFTTIYAFYASMIKVNVESRYEMVASNLAQEGVEIIRNRRDQNILRYGSRDNRWKSGLSSTCYPRLAAGGPDCSGGNRHIRKIGDIYENGGAEGNTPFERICRITDRGGSIDVECDVFWDSIAKGQTNGRSIRVNSTLTNWYDFTP